MIGRGWLGTMTPAGEGFESELRSLASCLRIPRGFEEDILIYMLTYTLQVLTMVALSIVAVCVLFLATNSQRI